MEILGKVGNSQGFHAIERHPEAVTVPGLMLLRFNSPIVFFNAPYFKREVLATARAAGPSLKWIVLDMLPITMIDATGLYIAEEVADALHEFGVVFAAAGRQTEWRLWAKSRQWEPREGKISMYSTMDEAIRTFRQGEGNAAKARQVSGGR
jgi:MFS superfamily sulfate permease-like transporter